MDKRGGGREAVSRHCVEYFLSHISEKCRRGTRLYCVLENCWYPKCLWITGEGRGGVSRCLIEDFLSLRAE